MSGTPNADRIKAAREDCPEAATGGCAECNRPIEKAGDAIFTTLATILSDALAQDATVAILEALIKAGVLEDPDAAKTPGAILADLLEQAMKVTPEPTVDQELTLAAQMTQFTEMVGLGLDDPSPIEGYTHRQLIDLPAKERLPLLLDYLRAHA